MNFQGWFSLGLTGLISLQLKGFSRVFSSTMVQKHPFFRAQCSKALMLSVGLSWKGSRLCAEQVSFSFLCKYLAFHKTKGSSRLCCSVSKLRLTLCIPMDSGTPGSSVFHCLPEFAQIHVHWVRDASWPFHTHPWLRIGSTLAQVLHSFWSY